MPRVIIVFYSKTGNTEEMAKAVEKGITSGGGEVVRKHVDETHVDELPAFDGIIIGSPTYFGTMATAVKRFVDESIKYYGKLEGKVGGAFANSGALGGGNETTVLDILKALLIHGMIIQGRSEGGDHYGPVSVGKPDSARIGACEEYGRRIAHLVRKIARQKGPKNE
jgi:NAD(P)H dehydrogenase (quinone)